MCYRDNLKPTRITGGIFIISLKNIGITDEWLKITTPATLRQARQVLNAFIGMMYGHTDDASVSALRDSLILGRVDNTADLEKPISYNTRSTIISVINEHILNNGGVPTSATNGAGGQGVTGTAVVATTSNSEFGGAGGGGNGWGVVYTW